MTQHIDENIGIYLQISFAFLSLLCALLTLYIIKILNKWNGYLLLIVNLTIAQSIYDLSIILDVYRPIHLLSVFLRASSGIAGSLFTLQITYVVIYVVIHLKSIDVQKYYFTVLTIVLVPSFIVAFFETYQKTENFFGDPLYYYARIIEILFNILLYMYLVYAIQKRDNRNKIEGIEYEMDPVKILAKRLKYYPIVQVFCRLGVAIYEGLTNSYGYNNKYDTNAPQSIKVLFFIYCISQPSAGIGYFLVFLNVSPGGYACFKILINKYFCFNMTESLEKKESFYVSNRTLIESNNTTSRNSRTDEFSFISSDTKLTEPLIYTDYHISTYSKINYNDMDDDELLKEINLLYVKE